MPIAPMPIVILITAVTLTFNKQSLPKGLGLMIMTSIEGLKQDFQSFAKNDWTNRQLLPKQPSIKYLR